MSSLPFPSPTPSPPPKTLYPTTLFSPHGSSLRPQLTARLTTQDWENEAYRISRIPEVLYGEEVCLGEAVKGRIELLTTRLRRAGSKPGPVVSQGRIIHLSTPHLKGPFPASSHTAGSQYGRPPEGFWDVVAKRGLPGNAEEWEGWIGERERSKRDVGKGRTALGGRKRVTGEGSGSGSTAKKPKQSSNKQPPNIKPTKPRPQIAPHNSSQDPFPPPGVLSTIASSPRLPPAPKAARKKKAPPQSNTLDFRSQKGSSSSTVEEDKGKSKGKSRYFGVPEVVVEKRAPVKSGREEMETFTTFSRGDDDTEEEEEEEELPVARGRVEVQEGEMRDVFMGFGGGGGGVVDVGDESDFIFNPSQQPGTHLSTPKHMQIHTGEHTFADDAPLRSTGGKRKLFAAIGGSGDSGGLGGGSVGKGKRRAVEVEEREEEEVREGDSGSQHLQSKFATSNLNHLRPVPFPLPNALPSPAGKSQASTYRGSSPPSSGLGVAGTQMLEEEMGRVGRRAVSWLGRGTGDL